MRVNNKKKKKKKEKKKKSNYNDNNNVNNNNGRFLESPLFGCARRFQMNNVTQNQGKKGKEGVRRWGGGGGRLLYKFIYLFSCKNKNSGTEMTASVLKQDPNT